MAGRRGRALSEDERTLWQGVTRSIAPLKKKAARAKAASAPADEEPGAPPPSWPVRAIPSTLSPASPPRVEAKKPPPLAPLDRKDKQRLARGRRDIDARLDLHGLTQDEAHGTLLRFLHRAQAKNHKLVLVITGKGVRGDGGRGVLKRQVPLWLALPEFRELVIGFDSAAIAHGGEGALYVRVRKRRG
ncbi:MAG: Smr/MutS family protein [Pseudorhodoplanes sp.]|nr:Smr/MutS family protein [Pseudorhodoplanes sp.]